MLFAFVLALGALALDAGTTIGADSPAFAIASGTTFVAGDGNVLKVGSNTVALVRDAAISNSLDVSAGTVRLVPAPALVSTASYHLDAADESTVRLNESDGVESWFSAEDRSVRFDRHSNAPGYTNRQNRLRVMSFANDREHYSRLVSTGELTQRTVYLCLAPQKPSWVAGEDYYLSPWGWYGKGQIEHSLRYRSQYNSWELLRFPSSARMNGKESLAFTPNGDWQIVGLFNDRPDETDVHYSTFRVAVGCYETWDAAKNFNGDIGEIIAFDRVLAEDERAVVENYLATKWGLKDKVWHDGADQGAPACMPTAALTVRVGAVFDLAGENLTVASLICDGLITNSSPNAATLTVTGVCFCRGTVSGGVALKKDTGTSFWSKWEDGKTGSDFFLRSLSADAFELHARRVDESVPTSWCLSIGNFNQTMWTHNKLVLYVRSLNGKTATVGFTVSHQTNGETVMVNAESKAVSGRAWRKFVLGLDTDFGLGDRSVDIRQVKIGIHVDDWKADEVGGIEVKGLRFCGPDEVAESSVWREGDAFVSVPSRPYGPPAATADALKVFFAFDNEDVIDSVDQHRGNAPDAQQYGGFREMLFAGLEGQAMVVTNLDAAEAIVYSRARPDPALAAALVAAVNRGVPLFAASEVGDPEVEAILPCAIGHDVLQDLPPRRHVVPTAVLPVALSAGLSDTTFGVYRSCAAKAGSRTLLRFDDGTPALVEGSSGAGKVLYCMLCVGSSLVPGKVSQDAFLIRALSYLTGKPLPERDRVAAQGEWYDGVSSNCFGRFGWEVGSGLLVGSLGTRLSVSLNDAGYEFALPRVGTSPRQVAFAGDRAQTLSLGGEVFVDGVNAYRFDASLGYPGVRWDFHCREMDLRLENLQGAIYVPLQTGGRIVNLSEVDEVDLMGMAEPWLLLSNGSENDSPLMLVFQHRPDRLAVMRSGSAIEGLRLISTGTSLGVVVPTWICGARTVDTTEWTENVPLEIMASARRWCVRAFAYPVTCRERFRLNEREKRVEIRSDYETLSAGNDWNVPGMPYAPVSPVAWTLHDVVPAAEDGSIARFDEGVVSSGLVTCFGDLALREGSTSVTWSLPLFKPDLGLLPHVVGYDDEERIANDCFAAGVVFTRGGGVRVDPVQDRTHPYKIDAIYNINMHNFLLGLLRCTENPFIYTAENRRLMRRRFAWRMLTPLEELQYKMTCRWRREPVSGVRYTIYMNSPRDISTVFEPADYGSGLVYGDSNETVRMILAAVQKAADQMGQYGVVKANWDVLSRQVPSFVFANDDWLNLCSGCLEYGGPGSIDMLNAEFACMMSLARLAEIAGDENVRAQALYRASRRLCPTLARYGMRDYFRRNGLTVNADTLPSTGYNEQGAVFEAVGKVPSDNCFLDMSQGIPRDLLALYDWYGYDMLRAAYLPRAYALTGAGGQLNYYLVSHLAIAGEYGAAELLAKLRDVANNTSHLAQLKKDWPGMDAGSYMEYALHRIGASPIITDCRDVNLHDARYDPATERLTLEFTPGDHAALGVDGRSVRGLAAGVRTIRVIHLAKGPGLSVFFR